MSQDELDALRKKIAEDETLRIEFARFAAKHGFGLDADRLSEAELEAVAGGLTGEDAAQQLMDAFGSSDGPASLSDISWGDLLASFMKLQNSDAEDSTGEDSTTLGTPIRKTLGSLGEG